MQRNVQILLTSDASPFSFFFVFDQTKLSSTPPFHVLSPPSTHHTLHHDIHR